MKISQFISSGNCSIICEHGYPFCRGIICFFWIVLVEQVCTDVDEVLENKSCVTGSYFNERTQADNFTKRNIVFVAAFIQTPNN